MEKKEANVKHEFTSSRTPDTINISNQFWDLYLRASRNPELLNIPIITYRIIFKIIVDTRHTTFNSTKNDERNIRQLSLFDETFRTENNTYSMFRYKIKELDPYRNINNIKIALEFLEQYKKNWYKQKNSKGKVISSYGGLISQPNYSDGEVSFLVSSYWLEKLIELNEFNSMLYSTLVSFKEPKHVLFYLWIERLNEAGTTVKYKTINKTYNLNYKSARELYINFILPFRKKLNKISSMSFGAGIKGDNITFKKTPLVQTDNLEEKTISNLMVRQKTRYFKERHKLNDTCLVPLTLYLRSPNNFQIINDAYKIFIKNCRGKKIKASDITGEKFKNDFESILLVMNEKEIWNIL